MDYEQLCAQVMLVVFAILFTFVLNSTQKGVENDYKKVEKKVKHLKQKVSFAEYQDNEFFKQILREKLNDRKRNIIAASVKGTVDEKLEKLQHISDSIRSFKYHSSVAKDHLDKRPTIITNTERKDSELWALEKKIEELRQKTPEPQDMLNLSGKKPSRIIKRYSVYHCKIYLNNGISS